MKMRRLGQLSVCATTLLLMLLMLLVPVAIAESSEDFVDGEKILIQSRGSGEWLYPLGSCPIPEVPIFCFGLSPDVTESNKIWTVREQDDGSIMLQDSIGQVWRPSDLPTFNWFPYVAPAEPTSYYAVDVPGQINASVFNNGPLPGGDFNIWDVEPNYGFDFGIANHTQGIAMTGNGVWVQTQSAGIPHCDGVLQSINPITERDLELLTWNVDDVCDPHTTGIQAVGNVIAVHSSNEAEEGSGVPPDVRFFEVSNDGEFQQLHHLRVVRPLDENVIQVGFVHVKSVGYFLFTKHVGGLKIFFRMTLEDDGEQWTPLSWSGRAPPVSEGGMKLIMEAGTGNMYLFSLGVPSGFVTENRNKFNVKVIKPTSDYASNPTEFWTAVSEGTKTVKIQAFGDFELNAGGLTATDHSFRYGGDVNVNESGGLEFLQAPRDFLNEFLADVGDQADYRVIRPRTGEAVNPVTKGRIKSFKCIEETADGPGDDEVYFITNSWRSYTFEGVDDETEIEFGPWPYSFAGELKIKSSSNDGSYVYLMEDDSGAVFGARPETIGKIFIPPAHYALPGTHSYTATLRGDDGEYEVTYEITKGVPPVADAGGPYTVNEGASISLDGTGSSVGDGDTLSFAWDFNNDGEFDEATGSTPTFSAALLDDGTYIVGLRLYDGLDFAEGYASVTVVNVDPTVSASGDVIDENGIATVSGNIVDPGILDTFTVVIDWGEGAPMSYAYAAGDTAYSETHQYLDDDPTGTSTDIYPVSVTVTDDDGGIGTAATQLTVNNEVPTATIDAVTDFAGNVLGEDIYIALVLLDLNLSVSFMDVGSLDTHSVVVDWADGTVNGGFTTNPVADTHAFASTGNYSVLVTVTDDDTGAVSVSQSIEVVDAAGAVADMIEKLAEFTNDPTQDPAAVALVEDALDELNGNNGGQASNGVLDKLENGNWNAALVKISKVIELLLAADASPMTVRQNAAHGKKHRRSLRREEVLIAGGGELEFSVAVSQLVLSAKSTVADLVRIAKEEAKSRNDWRKIAEAEELIGEGDQLFVDGDAIAAVESYRTALTRLH